MRNGLQINLRARRFVACRVWLLLLLAGGGLTLRAQDSVIGRDALGTYAITNARIVTVSGATVEKGTVVIRDGLIAAVGANVSAPADARVIDGAGLTVYPGLTDASTNLGLPALAPRVPGGAGGGRAAAAAAAPSPTPAFMRAGVNPETDVTGLLELNPTTFDGARNAGLTTAVIAPRDGIFLGQAALVNLANETAAGALVVRAPVAQYFAFRTSGQFGVFPDSLMGVMATFRQALLDAQRYRDGNQIYERNPRGQQRLAYDKSLVALQAVLEGKVPVVFVANSENEILRALKLAQEFNLKAIIAGGLEAWKVTDQLKAQNVPVLLSLNFPRRLTTQSAEADPELLNALRARVEAPKTAGKLAAAGIRFAFQSGGMTNLNDYVPNAAKTVENGLNRDAALRALTLNAAEIYGVADRLGSIEVGKIANLTVMRGDIFSKDARLAHLFIDGRQIDIKPPAPPTPPTAPGRPGAPPAPNAAPLNIAGNWNITLNTNDGQTLPGTIIFRQEGENITGTFQSALGGGQINDGKITGNTFTATLLLTIQAQTINIVMTGKVEGDTMSGTASSPMGNATFTAMKTP